MYGKCMRTLLCTKSTRLMQPTSFWYTELVSLNVKVTKYCLSWYVPSIHCLHKFSLGSSSIKQHLCSILLTAVDCGTLTNPANGQVSHTGRTRFGQTAAYSCDTGYILVGDSNRTCQATGRWSGSEATCQSMLY